MKKLCLILVMVVSLFAVTSCGKVDTCQKQIEKSRDSVKQITTEIKMLDSNVLVYKLASTASINEKDYVVKTEISTLSPSFTLDTQATEETVTLDRNKLIGIHLSKDLLSSYEYKDNVLTAKVSADNFGKVLGETSIKAKSEVELVCKYENKLIKEITFNFVSTNGFTSSIVMNFSY